MKRVAYKTTCIVKYESWHISALPAAIQAKLMVVVHDIIMRTRILIPYTMGDKLERVWPFVYFSVYYYGSTRKWFDLATKLAFVDKSSNQAPI